MLPVDGLPKFDTLMLPTIAALKKLGGSASNDELEDTISEALGISDEQRAVLSRKKSTREFAYRLAWARSYLKRYGAITNSSRGVWSLSDKGERLSAADVENIKREVRAYIASKPLNGAVPLSGDGATEAGTDWDELLGILQGMNPTAFERLCQRLLREAGFTSVEVTGRSNDGGIDGFGQLRVGLISFRVLFQCKRWKGTVGSNVVRDFRGAMSGRADKGIIITTGSFTSEAKREAARDGAAAIDLIDGEELCNHLERLSLGVSTETVVTTKVEAAFFQAI
jgi:restriction system protein